MTHAYFLVAHGSRRPQSLASLQQLADYFRAAIAASHSPEIAGDGIPWVTSGCLEFQAVSLSEQLVQFYRSLPPTIERVHVLPIFLLPGNHVREDIPIAIQAAQEMLQANQSESVCPRPFRLHPHLGTHPQLKVMIQQTMSNFLPESWILMGHGSRRPEGNVAIQELAGHLRAVPAFWAKPPALETQVMHLVSQGIRSIGVIPYFLFSGKITDAIAAQVEQLSQQYPEVAFDVLEPLNPTPALASALLDLSQSPNLVTTTQAKVN